MEYWSDVLKPPPRFAYRRGVFSRLLQLVDGARETGNSAGCRVARQNAFGRGLIEHAIDLFELTRSACFVLGRNRASCLLDQTADAGFDLPVSRRSLKALTVSFYRRWVLCQNFLLSAILDII
jgi:hypothetical protein